MTQRNSSAIVAPGMEKTVFIKDLQFKTEIEAPFSIKYISLMEARDGRQYINMVLSDATGDLEARIWTNASQHAQELSQGNFVQVKGKLNLFQGRKQFIVQTIARLDRQAVNPDDYIFKAPRPPEEMYQELLAIVAQCDDYYIRNLLEHTLQDAEITRRLKLWQAGKSIHHAYRSGLLEHILSCAQLAQKLSPHYQCNFNYVLAGCVLHDLCKIYELSEGLQVEYTEEGRLVGHLVKGVELIDRFSYRIKGFPYSMKLHLKHILLSHHGECQFGSPKPPQTSEAMLVHLIDLLDSKMNTFETIKRTDTHRNDWSSYVKHLDRIVYKLPLPHYPQPLPEKPSYHSQPTTRPSKPENKPRQSPRPHSTQPLRQNLGSLLKGFKVAPPPSQQPKNEKPAS